MTHMHTGTTAQVQRAEPASASTVRLRYRYYVLSALLLVATFNFIDRVVVGVLQEPIKREFGLSDFQLGLLGGPAFAILYVASGFPLARLAEHRNRTNIIAWVFAIWSGMTAVCGLAVSFAQLMACRVGVSIGEAGAAPSSQSMISDYFSREERAGAFAVYSLGVPIGNLIAAFGGGIMAMTLGWRSTFIALGAAGLILAIVFKLTVKEPARRGVGLSVPPFATALAYLLRKRTFRSVMMGNSVALFTVYTLQQYLVSFFLRRFGFHIVEAAMVLGVVAGLAGGAGTFLGGALADRFAGGRSRILAHVPVIGFLLAFPLYLVAFVIPSWPVAVVLLMVGSVFHFFYLGPSYAMTQGVAEPRMRATATATLLFAANLLGAGLGPPILGFLSDFIGHQLAGGMTGSCHFAWCVAGGLPAAMAIFSFGNLWAAAHFWRAGRDLPAELVDDEPLSGGVTPAQKGI